ncbi:MAG: hypothetical protein ACI9PX_000531 [Reinekea sp.]|jgi:hypothetical protein|tara:strand:+ start:1197 stop:1334 length:138 start_codon:yes stop_codon:yes gene_type:complete
MKIAATSNTSAEVFVPLDERHFQTAEMTILKMGDFTASVEGSENL